MTDETEKMTWAELTAAAAAGDADACIELGLFYFNSALVDSPNLTAAVENAAKFLQKAADGKNEEAAWVCTAAKKAGLSLVQHLTILKVQGKTLHGGE